MRRMNSFLMITITLYLGLSNGPICWAQQGAADTQTVTMQNSFTAIRGNNDQELIPPQLMTPTGLRQDAGALQELQAFRSATGFPQWNDLAGSGTIRYGNQQDIEEQASLEIRQSGYYRLDSGIDGSAQKSLRIAQAMGAAQHGNKPLKSIDSRNAAMGLFAFPHLEEQGFPSSDDILIDQGMIRVDGSTYHRITLEWAHLGSAHARDLSSWVTIDLYFDSQTHLLGKSASLVHGGGPATMVRVLTYSDYRKEKGALFPMNYRETLNGQLAWTLQLTQIHSDTGLNLQDFHF